MTGGRRSAREFEIVFRGSVAAIRLAQIALEEYRLVVAGTDQLSVKRRVHLARSFREYCEHRPHRLTAEKFKKEGNFSDGRGGQVAIWTFKVWKWRLYGAPLSVSGEVCFVGVRVDADKKQDRADKQILKLAAADISQLVEHRPVRGER